MFEEEEEEEEEVRNEKKRLKIEVLTHGCPNAIVTCYSAICHNCDHNRLGGDRL